MPAGARTVGEVVLSVRDRLSGNDRLVTRVQCGGSELTDEAWATAMQQSIGEVDRIDLHTEPRRPTVLAALRQAREALGQAMALRAVVADALTEGRLSEAMDDLGDLIRHCAASQEAVHVGAALMNVDLDALAARNAELGAGVRSVAEALRQLKEALTQGDHVLLADQLRFEFDRTLTAWDGVVAALITEIEGGCPS
ncbi:MAG: hypothetical protein HUU22_03500 [Phycisphaerae bacterium]|nr:hypothetical protein [Phycisphaerae bacterium]NUQ45081.1 hypothetical protein [Phycisphaerae bacterium]